MEKLTYKTDVCDGKKIVDFEGKLLNWGYLDDKIVNFCKGFTSKIFLIYLHYYSFICKKKTLLSTESSNFSLLKSHCCPL